MSKPNISVDYRSGSKELCPYLECVGVTPILEELPFGDFMLVGHGPTPRPWVVGVERKTIGDMVKCITDGRFSGHQLPGMCEYYDHKFLLVEGRVMEAEDGLLMVWKHGKWRTLELGRQRFMYSALSNFLTSIKLNTPVHVIRTEDERHTAVELKTLYKYYAKPWDQHQSHNQPYDDTPTNVMAVQPSLIRRVANQLKGVGWDRAGVLASHFPSVWHLANASEKDILDAGRNVSKRGHGIAGTKHAWGAKLSASIHNQLRGGKS